MDILWTQAIFAGLVATALMTIVMYAGKIMGLATDMPRGIGLFFVGEDASDGALYGVGLTVHFLLGAFFGILYALLFHVVGADAAIGTATLWGAVFGIFHGIFIGLLLGLTPALHSKVGIGDTLSTPGFFGRNISIGMPLGLIVLHIIYGAMVGVVYGAPM